MSSIYLPGRGMVNLTARRIDKAVNEYDERLFFRLNPQTGDWCVYRKQEHGKEPIAVLGFGRDIPHPNDVIARLRQTDSYRRDLVRQINEHNDRRKKELQDAVDEGQEAMAEALEWGTRKMKGSGNKIFVPRGV